MAEFNHDARQGDLFNWPKVMPANCVIDRICEITCLLVLTCLCQFVSAASSVHTSPSNPSTSDDIAVIYRIESNNSPLTFESFSFSISGSEISVVVKIIEGTYSEFGALSGSLNLGRLPKGSYNLNLYHQWRYGLDGAPYSEPIPTAYSQFAVSATAQLVTVIEFHHSILDHYFLTADPAEAAYLVANSATLGWTETGHSFTAFSLDDASGNNLPVCRFYGSISPGPNSHFYTASNSECNFLRQLQATTPDSQPRWNYEGLSFRVVVPDMGLCPSVAPFPLYRFYNDRALQNDSNHRYVASIALFNNMLAQGWISEGAVMCTAVAA